MFSSQVKRSAGTRPNTPVFEEEDQENPEDQNDEVDELHDDYNEEFVDSHPQPVPSLFSGGIKDRLGPSVFSKPESRPAGTWLQYSSVSYSLFLKQCSCRSWAF